MKHTKAKILFFLTMFLLIAALAVFVGFRMRKPAAIDADFSVLCEALEERGLTENTVPGTTLELKRRFNLLESDYPSVLYLAPVTYMNVEEILVVEVRSSSEADAVEEAIQTSLDAQKKLFENYGVDQYGYLKDAKIYRNERYVVYAAGAKAEDVLTEIRFAIER